MVNYLDKLKEKCNVEDKFISTIEDLFNKLIYFGYITQSSSKRLKKKLYNNIDTIILGNSTSPDYKSGYYDANKKELYIKDISNVESIYLRILYAITSKELSNDVYHIGYSLSSMSKKDYKIEHLNFGINRAIVSNLVCRLLYTLPTTLSIMPTYRNYENDFLGNKISSDNDIYFLEGKILTQICYVFNINQENLYSNLFNKSPIKYLDRTFTNLSKDVKENLFTSFDNVSRMYSNYNKLCYLNKLLDENYLNMKKNILNNNIKPIEDEQRTIKLAIKSAISKLNPVNIDQEDEINVESSLAEKINFLEEHILLEISSIQKILVDNLILQENKYSAMEYALKLKELDSISISYNQKLKNEIFNTITRKLLKTFENSVCNLIEKIKYSLVNEILSSEKYLKIYKDLKFKRLHLLEKDLNYELVAITIDNSFIQLVKIDNLEKTIQNIENNTISIKIENLKYILDNPSSASDVHKIEQIFTTIKNKHNRISQLKLEDLYLFTVDNKNYIIAIAKNDFYIIQIDILENHQLDSKILKLSESYSIFNLHDGSNLPSIYRKPKNSKRGSIFSILFS